MNKAEFMLALGPLADETAIYVHIRGAGRQDIRRVAYRGSNGDNPAYVDIIIDATTRIEGAVKP